MSATEGSVVRVLEEEMDWATGWTSTPPAEVWFDGGRIGVSLLSQAVSRAKVSSRMSPT
jgi:hypothetical protein